ncbi:MAG: hypothetical protein K2G87_05375, partial [Oscillospiraceae bacterium]|nr:hypothetical protein [Oscillospiraceae bacterium]
MKKKIFAAVLAVLTAASMAACGSGETGGNDVNDVPDVTVSEETTKTDSETEATTEKPVETVPETETEAETEKADGNASAAGDIYKGTGYTINVDSEKWADASAYIKLISEYSANLDTGLDVSAEDIENLNDGMFFHADLSGTNFNIVCNEIGDLGADFDISMFAGLMKEQYTAAGITYLGDDVVEHNGKNWLKIEVEVTESGTAMKMLQYMALNGVDQYVVTYTANKDNYDKTLSDFEEVFDSFE